jgi:hypothetical protein
MLTADLARYVALGVGGLQVLANGVLLVRGVARLPGELSRQGATERIAELLRAAWVYGVLGNLCLGVVLVLVARALGRAEPLPATIARVIAVYYVVAGVALYAFVPGRHEGFLVFAALGVILLAALWLA